MEPIIKQRMRVITVTRQSRNYSTLLLVAIAALAAVIIASLFLPRAAHGEDGLRPVAYIPILSVGEKPEPAVVPASSMTAAPPTATPQPELGEPPFVPWGGE
jgi:hypothetical protein